MPRPIILALLAALALALPPATLGAAGPPCWTTSKATPVETALGHYYVVKDAAPTDVWVYEETNGIPGLQRADDNVNDVKDCRGLIPADKIVF